MYKTISQTKHKYIFAFNNKKWNFDLKFCTIIFYTLSWIYTYCTLFSRENNFNYIWKQINMNSNNSKDIQIWLTNNNNKFLCTAMRKENCTYTCFHITMYFRKAMNYLKLWAETCYYHSIQKYCFLSTY